MDVNISSQQSAYQFPYGQFQTVPLPNIVPPFGKRRQICRLEITGERIGHRWQALCHYTDRRYILRARSIVSRVENS